RLHWIVFLKAGAVFVLGLGLLYFDTKLIGLIVMAVGLVMAVPPWVSRVSSEFGVTSKRVIIKVGVIQRRTLELLIRQVEAISVDQSLTGRMLNFGTITLTGTGGGEEKCHNISKPVQ